MPKVLYLVRHGRALDAHAGGVQADHARLLSPRGEAEIMRLAEHLRARQGGFQVDTALVSSAARTQRTATLLGVQPQLVLDALYNADVGEILAVLRKLPDSCGRALLVAHNPGISWLAQSLLRPLPVAGLSPGAFLALSVGSQWSELDAGTLALIERLDPPNYRCADAAK